MRGRTTGSGGPSEAQACVLPNPHVLLLFAGSERRAGSLAACLQLLQVATVNLDLIDWHLDEQGVLDDAVWSLLRHQLQHRSFHFAFAPPFRDVPLCGFPKSTARKRCLYPSQVDRTRIPNLLEEPQRRAALCVHGRGDFLFSIREPTCVRSVLV